MAHDLVIFRLKGAEPIEPARLAGLTGQRIGDSAVRGGFRDGGSGPEVRLADPGWATARRGPLQDGRPMAQPPGPDSRAAGYGCRDTP